MKKFLSFFALAIICAMAISCGNNSSDNASDASDSTTVAELQTGTFESIANALKNKEWATADSIANIVYSNKSNCTAEELANVGIAYFALAGQSKEINAKQQFDYINRAIECCNAAETADADVAKEIYEKSGKDIASLKAKYTEKLPDYEKAANDSTSIKVKVNVK